MNNFGRNLALWIIIGVLLVALFNLFQNSSTRGPQSSLAFSDFLHEVEKGSVADVTIQGPNISGHFSDGRGFATYAPQDPQLVSRLTENNVRIIAAPMEDNMSGLLGVLISWFPMLLFIGVWIFFMRQMQSGGGKAMGFGKSRAKLLTEKQGRVTFEDVAGVEDVVAMELEDVAVEIVGTGLGGDGDDAGTATELGGEDAGERFELADGFDAGGDDDGIKRVFVVVDAVDEPGVSVGAAAEGVEIRRAAGVKGRGPGEVLTGLAGGNARVEINELGEVTPVEGEFAHRAGADDFAEFGGFGTHKRGGGSYLDRFRDVTDGELEVGAGLLVNFEEEVGLDSFLKALLLDGDGVSAGDEERDVERARVVALGAAGGVLVDFGDGDGGGGDGGTSGISYGAENGTGGDLAECR